MRMSTVPTSTASSAEIQQQQPNMAFGHFIQTNKSQQFLHSYALTRQSLASSELQSREKLCMLDCLLLAEDVDYWRNQ